jgi:hypothetical protein
VKSSRQPLQNNTSFLTSWRFQTTKAQRHQEQLKEEPLCLSGVQKMLRPEPARHNHP